MRKFFDIKESLKNKLRFCAPAESEDVILTGEEAAVAWTLIQKYELYKNLLSEAYEAFYENCDLRQDTRLRKVANILNLSDNIEKGKKNESMLFECMNLVFNEGYTKEVALEKIAEDYNFTVGAARKRIGREISKLKESHPGKAHIFKAYSPLPPNYDRDD